MTSFSEALKFECKGTGVEVQTLCPSFVDTNIAKTRANLQPAIFFPSPEKFAKHAVATIGIASTTAGYWPHVLQVPFLINKPRGGTLHSC